VLAHRTIAALIAAVAVLPAPAALAYTAFLDQFATNRFDLMTMNGSLFVDPFEDGAPPPSAPNFVTGQPAAYSVLGTIPGNAESMGRLALDSALGAPVTTGNDEPRRVVRATLINGDNANPAPGLLQQFSFLAAGRWDLVALPNPLDVYGIEFHDSTNFVITELTQLLVRRSADPADTSLHLTFLKQTLPGGGIQVFSDTVLTPPANANQVVLFLRHIANTNTITAEYRFSDNGNPLSDPIPLLGSSTMFNGENFVRASFLVAEVPEPGTYAMLLAGLGILGWVARRRMRA
jgi:hypothetical protein